MHDAQYAPVHGFPFLRVDRFHSALRGRALTSEAAFQSYADALLALDVESRRQEISNLPRATLAALPGGPPDHAAAFRRTLECGRLLRELAFAEPSVRTKVLDAASVPDEYSRAARIAGLYGVTRIAVLAGVRRWEDGVRRSFEAPPSAPPGAVVVRFSPPANTAQLPPLSRATAGFLLERRDALGRPVLSERDLARLAIAYAPSFEVPVAADYDRPGALRWPAKGAVPEVDASELVVYVHPAYTLHGGARTAPRVLLQLVYTAWFPERPAQSARDIYAGTLDAVVWRVTLAPDGEPLLYDTMHACGCYHQFLPTPRAVPRPAPDASEEWAFVPAHLPRIREGERPVVRLSSGTHAVERVHVTGGGDSLVRYALRHYDDLRSMARADGERRSAFGPDGLVAGSERAERFLLWPAGVRSAGTMRQWGRHATAFVGRRHFDDADLIERRFELDLEGTVK